MIRLGKEMTRCELEALASTLTLIRFLRRLPRDRLTPKRFSPYTAQDRLQNGDLCLLRRDHTDEIYVIPIEWWVESCLERRSAGALISEQGKQEGHDPLCTLWCAIELEDKDDSQESEKRTEPHE